MKASPARNVAIIGIIGLLVLAAAAWFLLLGPRIDQANQLSAEAAQVELDNLKIQNRYNQTLDLVAAAPESAAAAQKLFSTMPEQAELPTVIRQIADAAQKAGIKTTDILALNAGVPVPIVTKGSTATAEGKAAAQAGVNLATMDLVVSVAGDRPELLKFLDNLQSLDRAVLISATKFNQNVGDEKAKAKETLDVTGTMFVLQSKLPDLVAQVDALVAQAGKAASSTGNVTPDATTAQPVPSASAS
jgi:hypothetical protein